MEGFEKFNPKSDWDIYRERLENYFALHRIKYDRKSALLINLLDENSYTVIRDSCSPIKPIEKSYEELCAIMARHYTKTRSIHKERQRFDSLRRYPNEKVNDWYLRIKNTSKHCNFDGAEFEKILTLKYISGLRGKAFDRISEENGKISMEKAHEIGLKYDDESSVFIPKNPKGPPKQVFSDNKRNEVNTTKPIRNTNEDQKRRNKPDIVIEKTVTVVKHVSYKPKPKATMKRPATK